jgi:hypothetical protein
MNSPSLRLETKTVIPILVRINQYGDDIDFGPYPWTQRKFKRPLSTLATSVLVAYRMA